MTDRSRSFQCRLALPFVAALLVAVGSSPAHAQSAKEPSHWVVTASYTPDWQLASFLKDALSEDGNEFNMAGSEFSIGVGRGRTRGGDWNISFVRKPFRDGVLTTSNDSNCFNPAPNQPQLCNTSHETNSLEGVYINGVEASWFLSFVRIKDRVQAGLGVGVGIGVFNGNIRTVKDEENFNFVPGPGGGSFRPVTTHTDETKLVADELLPYFPLFNLEAEVAVIITPAIKAKVAYGMTFPGTGFRVAATYLIGAK